MSETDKSSKEVVSDPQIIKAATEVMTYAQNQQHLNLIGNTEDVAAVLAEVHRMNSALPEDKRMGIIQIPVNPKSTAKSLRTELELNRIVDDKGKPIRSVDDFPQPPVIIINQIEDRHSDVVDIPKRFKGANGVYSVITTSTESLGLESTMSHPIRPRKSKGF